MPAALHSTLQTPQLLPLLQLPIPVTTEVRMCTPTQPALWWVLAELPAPQCRVLFPGLIVPTLLLRGVGSRPPCTGPRREWWLATTEGEKTGTCLTFSQTCGVIMFMQTCWLGRQPPCHALCSSFLLINSLVAFSSL